MADTAKFLQLLQTLKQNGWNDEQLAQLSEEVAKAAFARFYTEAVAVLTPEDLQVIEDCATDEEGQAKIKELYTLRTGKDPEAEGKAYYDTFVDTFFEEMKNPPVEEPQ